MYNKSEEESDYLESLFLKPFCERYCEDSPPQKQKRVKTDQDQKKKTRRQTYHFYNPVPEHQELIVRKMSVNEKCREVQKSKQEKIDTTPYLSRKNQQKGFANQIRKKVIEKTRELPLSLESTQNHWLIIKEVQVKASEDNGRPEQNRNHTQQFPQKGGLPQSRRQSIKNQFEALRSRDDSKNIKTMMSYYKNKRLIKHMPKLADSPNLTNSEIQDSINLRIDNYGNKKEGYALIGQKISNTQTPKKKIYIREKNVRTEYSTPFTDVVKRRLMKTMALSNSSIPSFQLNNYLRSSKIGFSSKRSRPKTQIRYRGSENSHSKKQRSVQKTASSLKRNELCGWQQLSQKHEGQSMLLI